MSDIQRIIDLLQASASKLLHGKAVDCGLVPLGLSPVAEHFENGTDEAEEKFYDCYSTPHSLAEALQVALEKGPPPLPPSEPLSQDFKTGVNRVLSTFKTIGQATHPGCAINDKKSDGDAANDLAVLTSKRIFAAAKDTHELEALAYRLPNMAGRLPVLTTSNLPAASLSEAENTASPARGSRSMMLNSIFKSVRIPEFRFKWQFWAEKGQSTSSAPKDKSSTSEEYASRPKPLGEQIISIKEFYQHFNNIPTDSLKLRDSIHLFHLGVKPLWEDPRNTKGGAWYFKVSKDIAGQMWHEICLLAVGDVLQGAVETKREAFNDDICGVSYSVRWNAVQIAVWNRDSDNQGGIDKLLAAILDKLSAEVKPKEGSYWYKAHKEHKGFIAPSE
ncbi:translation initiation factor eIF 4e-like domain-containing protein [Lophiotrema nucula]|uniref:Translation initiation factor eIF 4e-like domain-containing protein n=1 Tax=Lophiotrema nucula TaxID=690887 RepID=A0A6A5Z0M9_9PLEO|nr:translation initiation factor eIF 4e-like domain-containing protein [Lophiotrema nucula]